MTAKEEASSPVQLVVVAESTANMISHWDSIKKLYLLPAIKHFHQLTKPNTELVSNGDGNRYGLVLFHSADRSPESLTQCYAPTRRVNDFVKLLDSINFIGGGSEHYSHITEGLATALQLFIDLKDCRNSSNDVERFCLLVSNTPPYQAPCMESYEFSGCTGNEIVSKLHELNVKMSIISPRHISELQQIYLQSNNGGSQLLNFAQDKRHFVLVGGFKLPTDKEPVPITESCGDDAHVIKTEDDMAVMEVTISTSQPTLTSVPPPETMLNNTQNTSSVQGNVSNLPLDNQAIFPQTSSATTTTSFGFTKPENPHALEVKSLPMDQQGNVSSNSGTKVQASTAFNSQSGPIMHNPVPTSNPPSMPGQISIQTHQPKKDLSEAHSMAKKVEKLAERTTEIKTIWAGTLEWLEKRKTPEGIQRIARTINCQMIQSPNHLYEINSSIWPSKLVMQIIQLNLINSPPVNTHLRSSKVVMLHFPQTEMLQMLVMNLQKDACGLINIAANQKPAEAKLIIIIVKKKDDRNQFLGLIPNDSAAVMMAIRSVVQSKQQQQQQQQRIVSQHSNIAQNSVSQQSNAGHTLTIRPGGISSASTMPMSVMNSSNTSVNLPQYRMPQQQQPQQQQPNFQQNTRFQHQQNMGQPNVQLASMQGSHQQQRMNQPVTIASMQRMVPSNPTQPQQRYSMPQKLAMSNIGGNKINTGTSGNSMQAGVMGNARLMSAGQGSINNPNNQVRMQMSSQIHGMTMNNNRTMQDHTQLKHLLHNNNAVQQTGGIGMRTQDSTVMRQQAPAQMQQQTFMTRSNMMQGMPNQRPY